MTKVLCVSGGLDSTIAWFYLKKPKSVYVHLKHRYEKKEELAIRRIRNVVPEFDVVQLDGPDMGRFESGANAFIPNRNLILATLAANYGNEINIVGIKGDRVVDKSPIAFAAMAACLNAIRKEGSRKLKVTSPFWKMTKTSIVRWALDNVPDAIDIFRASVSCYSPIGVHCGRCRSCFRKWIALEAAGLESYSWFDLDPRKSLKLRRYYRKRLHTMELQRAKDTIWVFKKYSLR